MRKIVQRALNKRCKARVEQALPGIVAELKEYSGGSDTTGTQWITLWMAVRGILRHKPKWVLESGTGSSTLVLAAAVQKLRRSDPDYTGRIVSMESVSEWFEIANRNFPEKYRDVVEIILGPREKYEIAMYRGYIHSNIPKRDFDFVLLDAPSFYDENGIAFCADIFRAMDLSSAPNMRGVVDGRASSVMVIQHLYGTAAARYWHWLFAADFSLPSRDFRDPDLNTPKDFKTSIFGRLSFVKFRK